MMTIAAVPAHNIMLHIVSQLMMTGTGIKCVRPGPLPTLPACAFMVAFPGVFRLPFLPRYWRDDALQSQCTDWYGAAGVTLNKCPFLKIRTPEVGGQMRGRVVLSIDDGKW